MKSSLPPQRFHTPQGVFHAQRSLHKSLQRIYSLSTPQKEPLKALLYFALFLLRLGRLLRGFLVYCAVDYAVVKYAVNVGMYAAYTYAKAAAVRGYCIEG